MRSASPRRTRASGCCNRPIAAGTARESSVALAPNRLTLNYPAAPAGSLALNGCCWGEASHRTLLHPPPGGSSAHKQLDQGDCSLQPAARTLFLVLNVFAIATARLSETLLPMFFDMLPARPVACSPSVLV